MILGASLFAVHDEQTAKATTKDGTCITLLGLTADSEIIEAPHNFRVAAGAFRSLQARHGRSSTSMHFMTFKILPITDAKICQSNQTSDD